MIGVRPVVLVATAFIAAVPTVGCASGDADSGTTDGAGPIVVASTLAPQTSAPPQEWTLEDQIDWVLHRLNGGATTDAEITGRFTDDFLTQVPVDAVMTTIRQLRSTSTRWTATASDGDGTGAEVALATDSDPWTMRIGVNEDGRIEFLALQPDTLGDVEPPSTFADLVDGLAGAGEVALLAADVSDGTCEAIHAVDADTARPIGSDFKLYVLGALADAVAAGDIGWDDMLAVEDALDSLPSGTFQDLDDGTERTVGDFATAMIAASDNTATDHLIHLLGRDRIEDAQIVYGHAEPSLNVPMLTTREFFVLKLVLSDAELEAYIAGDADRRSAILDEDIAGRVVTIADAEAWTAPRAIDSIEYFASPMDLCRAMVELHAHPEVARIRDVLGANPGIPVRADDWSYVGFKGGSEPGVLSLAWYLEGGRGTFVYVVNVTDGSARLPELELIELARAGIDLLPGH